MDGFVLFPQVYVNLNSKISNKNKLRHMNSGCHLGIFSCLSLAWWSKKCSCMTRPITPQIGQGRLETPLLKVIFIWFLGSTKTIGSSGSFSLHFTVVKKAHLKWSRSIICLKHGLNWTAYTQRYSLRRWEGQDFLFSYRFTILVFTTFGAYSFFMMSNHLLVHIASLHSWVWVASCGWTIINCLPPIISSLFSCLCFNPQIAGADTVQSGAHHYGERQRGNLRQSGGRDNEENQGVLWKRYCFHEC